MAETCDHVVIGGGIVGLSCALEIKRRDPGSRVVVLEKETTTGRHSSGRNSGVLHSGIYYPPDTLKARVCSSGAREMSAYCAQRGLPLNPIGKLLIPTREDDAPQLDLLEERGGLNGIAVRRIGEAELARMEPGTRSATGEALFVAQTSVVDSGAVLASVHADTVAAGIEIRCGGRLGPVDGKCRTLTWSDQTLHYGHALNAAGLHADSIAHRFGVGEDVVLLPFKGLYWKLDPQAGIAINHLIYPVPDLRVPFLGIHTTTSVDGQVYLGPTSVPAFGRENYRGFEGVSGTELARILFMLGAQFLSNNDGFRRLAVQEGPRYIKARFAQAASKLLPALKSDDLLPCDKVGIRAQMVDKTTGRMITDFLIRTGPGSTHVLNAISPAFTSAFPLARTICDSIFQADTTHEN